MTCHVEYKFKALQLSILLVGIEVDFDRVIRWESVFSASGRSFTVNRTRNIVAAVKQLEATDVRISELISS